LFFKELHPAFWTVTRRVLNNFRVHPASVLVNVGAAVFIRVHMLAPEHRARHSDYREYRERGCDGFEFLHVFFFFSWFLNE
jgi:hypothetical protein